MPLPVFVTKVSCFWPPDTLLETKRAPSTCLGEALAHLCACGLPRAAAESHLSFLGSSAERHEAGFELQNASGRPLGVFSNTMRFLWKWGLPVLPKWDLIIHLREMSSS